MRQGILRHSKARKGIESTPNPELDTLEAQAAKIADALAYVSHDTADALRAGVIAEDDLPRPVVEVLGTDRGRWSDVFVEGIVESSRDVLGESPPERGQQPVIRMGSVVSEAANAWSAGRDVAPSFAAPAVCYALYGVACADLIGIHGYRGPRMRIFSCERGSA